MHGWLVGGSLRAVEGGKTEWADKGERGYFDLEGKALSKRARPVVLVGLGAAKNAGGDDNPVLEKFVVMREGIPDDFVALDKERVLVIETESHGQLVFFAGARREAARWRSALKYAVSKERVFPESGPGVQRWLSSTRKAIKAGRQSEQQLLEMFDKEPQGAERVLDDAQGGTMLHVAARCYPALVGGDFEPPAKKEPPPPGEEERDLDIFYELSESDQVTIPCISSLFR